MTGTRAVRLLGGLVLACLVGLLLFAAVWRLQGGRIERVETPSMGTRAPVGSLLWVKPVDAADLHAGDFITFHAPGRPGTTFSHLVRAVHPDGTLSTGGLLSGQDPWRLQQADVVGEVQMTWPVAGWVVRVSPVLLGGFVFLVLVISRLRQHWRGPAALVGAAVVLAVVVVVYRPFTHAEQLAFAPVDDGARATYVGTGLLPVRLAADAPPGRSGDSVVLGDGEVGSVHVATKDECNRYVVHLSPAVPFWFWIGLVGACFVPAVASSVGSMRGRSDRGRVRSAG
jgi:hypothetical protein